MWGWLLFIHYINCIFTLILFPVYLYLFFIYRIYLSPVIIRLNWKMSTKSYVNKGQEFHNSGSSERLNCGESGSYASTGIQYIINEDHSFILNHKIYTGLIGFQWFTAPPEIITIE